MYYQTVTQVIADLKARYAAVITDKDLSIEGRAKRKKAVDLAKEAARQEALTYLRADIATLRRMFADNESRRRSATEAAAALWDFTRLQYEIITVRASIGAIPNAFDISGHDPVRELANRYEAVKHTQDKHKQRAFCEVAIDILQVQHKGKPGAGELVDTMAEDLAALLTTPEIEAANKAGQSLAELAITVITTVKVAKAFYQEGNDLIFGKSPFDELMTGVKVDYGAFDGPSGKWKVTVTLDDSPNTAEVVKP